MDETNAGVVARGARVFLRYPAAADEAAFCRLVQESEAHRRPWVPGPQAEGRTDGARWLRFTLQANASGRNAKLLVCRTSDDEILGCMNINEIVRGGFQNAFLGYWIGAPFARQGYGAEALALAVDLAFNELGLHRLEANIQPGNEASIALVRSGGFRLEGYSPRYLKIDGCWRDHERWAITREDVAGS